MQESPQARPETAGNAGMSLQGAALARADGHRKYAWPCRDVLARGHTSLARWPREVIGNALRGKLGQMATGNGHGLAGICLCKGPHKLGQMATRNNRQRLAGQVARWPQEIGSALQGLPCEGPHKPGPMATGIGSALQGFACKGPHKPGQQRLAGMSLQGAAQARLYGRRE